jgi:hypothetical protein
LRVVAVDVSPCGSPAVSVTWITMLGVFTIITGTILVNAGVLKQMIFKQKPPVPVLQTTNVDALPQE